MIKRILVALDVDRDTDIATRYASELARRFEASVSGLAMVHTQRIAAEIGPGGAVGALHYAEKLRASLTAETRKSAHKLIDDFEARLESAGITHDVQVREGVPYRHIVEVMKYHDVLIMGRSPHFFYPQPKKPTHTLARVVKEGIAPTLVVPAKYRPVNHVLIAYDGSDASARTMQRFAQLRPFGEEVEIELLRVCGWVDSEARKRAELQSRLAAEFLRAHGFERVRETVLEMDVPERRILQYAQEVDANMIVAGAHSVSALNRMAFGSTTHNLLKECEVPFFMYH